MRWRVSLLAVEGLLVGATGWAYHPLPIVGAWSHPKRIADRGQHQEQKLLQQRRVEFKAIRRRRALPTTMAAFGDGVDGGGCGGGDGPSKEYNRDAWQRRASRAMKYVSMPIVKKAGQPREQVRKEMGKELVVPHFHSTASARYLEAHPLPRCSVRDKSRVLLCPAMVEPIDLPSFFSPSAVPTGMTGSPGA